MLHGTAESVADQIRSLQADAGMTYLMAAPLSRRSFTLLTDKCCRGSRRNPPPAPSANKLGKLDLPEIGDHSTSRTPRATSSKAVVLSSTGRAVDIFVREFRSPAQNQRST